MIEQQETKRTPTSTETESVASSQPANGPTVTDAAWRDALATSNATARAGAADKLQTYFKLGLPNLWRVAVYRLKKRCGYFERTMPIGEVYDGPFFAAAAGVSSQGDWNPTISVSTDRPPDWFVNPLNGIRAAGFDRHWSHTIDFAAELGDIKTVWEASRFDWLPKWAWEIAVRQKNNACNVVEPRDGFAKAARYDRGAVGDYDRMESWVSDWVRHNPLNQGPNWRCGQEVSIRGLNMLLAGKLLGTLDAPTPAFLRFLAEHAQRIPATLSYAVGQDTNHGTTEAVALFLLGNFLQRHGVPDADHLYATGRYWLEERVRRLIAEDGSFAQDSVNYHRLMLMTLSLAEAFRREWKLPRFSHLFYTRARAATQWLSEFTDARSGDAPNLGPNDGAHLFNIDGQRYRDFRPAACFAMTVFADSFPSRVCCGSALCSVFQADEHAALRRRTSTGGEPMHQAGHDRVAGLTSPAVDAAYPTGRIFSDGGFVKFVSSPSCWGVLRYANFRFRPKEADILHLDLWCDGVNLLRDGGTYSYADSHAAAYFSGTASHNTAQFDGRDQMKRIGPFLFAGWLRMEEVSDLSESNGNLSWSGGYRDHAGSHHRRAVTARGVEWTVEDTVDGFQEMAVIRWRLAPSDWLMEGDSVRSRLASLSVQSTATFELRLTSGRESRRYLDQREIPVLEIVTKQPGTFCTTIRCGQRDAVD